MAKNMQDWSEQKLVVAICAVVVLIFLAVVGSFCAAFVLGAIFAQHPNPNVLLCCVILAARPATAFGLPMSINGFVRALKIELESRVGLSEIED